MKKIFLITVLSFSWHYSIAVEPDLWSLEDCMRYAVENSTVTAIRAANNDILKQAYVDAIMALLPSVNAGLGASFNFGRSLSDDNTYRSANSFYNSYNINASIGIFNGMSRINRIKMEKINVLSGRHELEAAADMLMYEVMETFMNVQYYKDALEFARQELLKSTSNLRQTERMMELEIKGFPDVAEMRAKEASDRLKVVQQQNLLDLGIILLKERMNFPIDRQLTTEEYNISDLPIATTRSALNIYENSLQILPKALVADANLEASRLSYKVSRASLLPSISMNAGINSDYNSIIGSSEPSVGFWDQMKTKRGQSFGFSMSIPIFERLSSRSNVRNRKTELKIASYERERTLRELYGEIETAVSEMKGVGEEWNHSKVQLEQINIAHMVNERMYEEGLINAIELHTSANRVMEARMQESYARNKYFLKCKLVNYYTGVPFIENTVRQ